MVWYSHLLNNFPQFVMIHTVKGFGIVNKAEMDVFLELSCFFDDPTDVGNLIRKGRGTRERMIQAEKTSAKAMRWAQDWKRSVFISMPKNAQTTTQLHSSHMLVK